MMADTSATATSRTHLWFPLVRRRRGRGGGEAGSGGPRSMCSTSRGPRSMCSTKRVVIVDSFEELGLGEDVIPLWGRWKSPSLLRSSAWVCPPCLLAPVSCLLAYLLPLVQRWIQDRNKKAMELVATGWTALQEVDRFCLLFVVLLENC
ncbi:hypothetical protein GUJ93_ZPchr0001g30511 [Zizania palustris]|uniref:Uncharacterized protein n=1 Tax=Zizania palustris TaxID=103762 RepID=A0A8J5S061_ZIZPA|nr:hypothetical protein GUJ93_ZPchr0001g30511 [Zizania palustris]